MRKSRVPSEVLVDTSALVALLVGNDQHHENAARLMPHLLDAKSLLVTHSYVILEASAVLQNRVGNAAAQGLHDHLVPLLDVAWVDEDLHQRGLLSWRTARRRSLSLVDCVSFVLMRELRLESAFTFDQHFAEQGFKILAPSAASGSAPD